MGIRGLSSFISNNAQLYLSKHKLHNSTIVIDGNNLSFQLYVWVSKSNSAFGGDYDRYYKCVCNFFAELKKCHIVPLVVFDGGYETRKLGTVWMRLKNKFTACRKVSPSNQLRRSVFPLLMRDFFRDILNDLGVSFAQCDFEADVEIAALARELQCPVLSYDSDFYVYDVLYIPFDSFSLSASSGKNSSGEAYSYIDCKIYKVERFLNAFGGLNQKLLPLMATLLGNDYIKRDLFTAFLAQIHMPKKRRDWTEQHRRILGLLDWLRKETVESAIPKILKHIKLQDRSKVEKQMKRAIAAYALTSSHVKQYLSLPERKETSTSISSPQLANEEMKEGSSDDEVTPENESDKPKVDDENSDIDSVGSTDDEISEENKDLPGSQDNDEEDEVPGDVPISFLHRYRKGMLPACFMDLLTKSRFYILQPQKEDFSLPESSHGASLPIIRQIVTLLLGVDNATKVSVITRRRMEPSRKKLFTTEQPPDADLPSLASIPSLSYDEKIALLMQPTGVAFTLEYLPEEWRLYFLALSYWATHSNNPPVSDKHIHAAILGIILLALVYPSKKENKEMSSKLALTCKKAPPTMPDIKSALENVKITDCKVLFSAIYVPHSHAESRNYKMAYDLSVVHSFAQLQSSLLCLMQLNQLLGMPLPTAPLHRLFSGTLLYNLYRALQPRSNVEAYLSTCLNDAPSLLAVHRGLANTLLHHLAPSTPRCETFQRNRQRRKRKREVSDSSEPEEPKRRESDSGSDTGVVDPNNRFALLSDL